MTDVILYTTQGCHLCEQAAELIKSLPQPVNIVSTEIGDDDLLVARYGTTIPVIEFSSGSQLNWPFSQQDIIEQL